MKIGIISDSFDALGGAAADEADGLLPAAAEIDVLQDDPGGTDEGRAMAEIIHAAAPGAAIDFYSGAFGADDIANGIAAMAADGAQVIVDDLSLPHEPFFQTGSPVDDAIDQFVADGGTYLTSAGNAGQNAALQARWQPAETRLPGIGRVEAMNFGTEDAPDFLETVHLQAGQSTQLTLQWDQPWRSLSGKGSAYSLAVALYRPDGTLLRRAATDLAGRDPVQSLTITPPRTGPYSVAIYANGGRDPGGTFKLIGDNNSVQPIRFDDADGSGSISGHALDPRAIAVGASDPDGSGIRAYSSSGPGVLLRGPDGNAFRSPIHLNKGIFTAPDGQSTSVPSLSTFDGTSASAALAAGWAGALLDADPGSTQAQIRAALRAQSLDAVAQSGRQASDLVNGLSGGDDDAKAGQSPASASGSVSPQAIALTQALLLGPSADFSAPAMEGVDPAAWSLEQNWGCVGGHADWAGDPSGHHASIAMTARM